MAVIIELLGWGGKRQRYFTVEGNSVTIGRSYQNDVVLDDAHISPNHLRLDAVEGGWLLTDLQSLNGVEIVKNPFRLALRYRARIQPLFSPKEQR